MSFQDLYAELPDLDCKGLCAVTCGAIRVSLREYQHLKETVGMIPARGITIRGGLPLAEFITDKKNRCPKLRSGRCTIYEHRPLPCRLWGMTKEYPCPYGCEPEWWLTAQEAEEFHRRAFNGP